MRSLLRGVALAALSFVAMPLAASADDGYDGNIRIGVLNDMSSLYQDTTGPGSVAATKMAVEDYLRDHPNTILKPTILSADHQNKPDIALSITRGWFDRDGVDVVMDVPASSTALAVTELAAQANKVHVNTSAGSARLTGDMCNANMVHWNFDNYALANVTGKAVMATGGDSWYFVTADYAFGHDLESQTAAVVKAGGGAVLGSVKVPLNTPDFSSYLLQAQGSGAKVIGLANAGGDTITSIKQASEFGITGKQRLAALLAFLTDIHSIGLQTAQGLVLTQGFYWDLNDATRDWTKRFITHHKNYPTSNQASNYAATLHLLKAAEIAKTHDGKKLTAAMKALPTDDALFGKGSIREDGRRLGPMYLFQVKTPAESKSEWDLFKLIRTVPPEEAWRPLSEGGCALVAKKS